MEPTEFIVCVLSSCVVEAASAVVRSRRQTGPLARSNGRGAVRCAAEHALQEGFAFPADALFAGEFRRIDIQPSLPADCENALFRKAGKEGVHRLLVPAGLIGESFIYVQSSGGPAVPDDVQDFPFSG